MVDNCLKISAFLSYVQNKVYVEVTQQMFSKNH